MRESVQNMLHRSGEHLERYALPVGGLLLLLTILVGLVSPGAFFFAYLTAAVLWLGLPLGCGALLLLHHLVGGRWGLALRPTLVAVTITLPVLAILFLPTLFGLHWLYPWADAAERSELAAAKRIYLDQPFFLLRTTGYLLLWCLGAWLLWRGSRPTAGGDGTNVPYAPRLGAVGLIVYVLTISFAAIDWVGSLEPRWHSSIFGLYVLIGQSVFALAVMVILRSGFPDGGSAPDASADVRNDLGTLLLTFVVLHAYFAFSQFLIIWNGNLPSEIGWYLTRTRGVWRVAALGIVLLHFALPFVLLLARGVKRSTTALFGVAAVLVFARWVDSVWMILPSFDGSIVLVLLLTVTSTLGLGGIWYRCFAWAAQRQAVGAW